jgi:hypothetical protein
MRGPLGASRAALLHARTLRAPPPRPGPRPAALRPAHMPQLQIWETEREDGVDPVVVISDGLDAPAAALSWDAAGRLLAAAAGSEALVWDVAAAKEGRADTNYACVGFEEGAAVTAVAFQPNGTLLVRRAGRQGAGPTGARGPAAGACGGSHGASAGAGASAGSGPVGCT